MPVFEMVCKQCGHYQEEFVPNSLEVNAVICRKCGSPNLEKIISAPYLPSRRAEGRKSNCDESTPCCGAAQRCDKPPCE
ncbi:FmdB family zinc ribbon protein [candidate division KSB1 bacterium]